MTAIDGLFNGDATTTNGGGSLQAAVGGGFALTINNPAVNIASVAAQPYPGTQTGLFDVATSVQSANLDYTRFGYWLRSQVTEGLYNAGAFTTGFVTPIAQIPTGGTATYTGTATGLYNDDAACGCSSFFASAYAAQVNLSVDFAALSIVGAMTNGSLTGFVGSQQRGPINDFGFSAAIDRSTNFFVGTMSVTSQPGGAWAFGPTGSGSIRGRFYGPNGREIGAVFGISEGSRRLIGSFGVRN